MAGFLHFDPDKWEPEKSGDDAKPCAKAANPAKPDEPPLATLATLARLPDDVADGLKRLSKIATPRLPKPEAWPLVVADAVGLASDGWAYQALALGWSPLDLFGAVTDPAGDAHGNGLAVWLDGRKVLALSADGVAVLKGETGRSYFLRPRAPGARLLWELGRGR